ncbi:MFS transporter [Virgisporangium aurantiacum]|uniref:MFS transporter n=1 Tax=Virgisporangium aurantiacum TaxID=175570 RepID=A0A8J3Z1F0_9ACTN|nr:MFS transporter [Virgisporangium aurantiacum]GIJ53333.1 MFS transporter [Virgisporangium aurantiacum]
MPGSLWRNRDFMLLWSGQVISTLGTRISSLAYPLLVLTLTGSPAQAGLVGFAQALPYIVWFLPAGALVDRWPRKRIMLTADLGRAIALGTVAAALLLDRITVAHLLVVAFVEGTLYVFFLLAEGAALPHVVPRAQLPTAVAQNQARDQGADLAGQPLGGFLFGLGHVVPFLVDAVSYLVAFVAMLPVRSSLEEPRQVERRHLVAEIGEGVRWLWGQHLIRTLVAFVAVGNLIYNALILIIIVRARNLGASPAAIGLLLAMFGVGALVGALAAPVIQRRIRPNAVMLAWLWITAVQLTLFAMAPNLVALGAVALVGTAIGPVFNVVLAAYRYALTPDRLQGRATSVIRLIAWGTIPIGALVGGFSVERFGAVPTFVGLAAVGVAMALAGTTTTHVRRAPRVETLERVS